MRQLSTEDALHLKIMHIMFAQLMHISDLQNCAETLLEKPIFINSALYVCLYECTLAVYKVSLWISIADFIRHKPFLQLGKAKVIFEAKMGLQNGGS